MKVSYIYITAAVIALAVLVYFTTFNNQKETPKEIANKEMPNDDVHKGMQNQGGTAPSKSNVSEKVKQQMELMKEDMAASPNDTAKMRMFADFLVAAHKSDEGIEYYNKILKKDPKRKDILFSLSFVYYQKKDFNKAEEITQRILKIDKKDLQAQYNLGAIAASKGETEKARNLWVKFIQENPNGELTELAKNNLTNLK